MTIDLSEGEIKERPLIKQQRLEPPNKQQDDNRASSSSTSFPTLSSATTPLTISTKSTNSFIEVSSTAGILLPSSICSTIATTCSTSTSDDISLESGEIQESSEDHLSSSSSEDCSSSSLPSQEINNINLLAKLWTTNSWNVWSARHESVEQLPRSWISAGCCADCSSDPWQCPQCLYTNKHSSPYCLQCDDGSTTGLTKPLRLDDDQLLTSLPYLENALIIIKEKFKHIPKEERSARPDFLSSSGSSVEELQAKIKIRRQAKEDDDDAKDHNFDPTEPQSEDEEDDDYLSTSDIICKGGGLDVSDDEDEEGDNSSDQSRVDVDLSELNGGAIDYLLNDRKGVDSRRLNAEEYVEVLIKNIENDDTRLLKIPKSMLIEMLKDPCALCGCNPIPGVDPVNSIDRLFSHIRMCKLLYSSSIFILSCMSYVG